MKGVIAHLAPNARVIDLTHEVPPGDIRCGAFSLMASCRYFPKGTVHVAVVDPGVGSKRTSLAVQTADYFFVGPDNGLLSWALLPEKIKAIHALENQAYFLPPVSRTFHGRDIFAPVAAHLACGVPVREFGPALKEFVRLEWPAPQTIRRDVHGQVVYLDRFGNAITNLDSASLRALGDNKIYVLVKGKRLCSVADYYSAVPAGESIAVIGSSGFLEIAFNAGSAAERLGLHVGDPVIASSDLVVSG